MSDFWERSRPCASYEAAEAFGRGDVIYLDQCGICGKDLAVKGFSPGVRLECRACATPAEPPAAPAK